MSRYRFTVFSFATLPEYIPPLCRGTLRILSKMLKVDFLRCFASRLETILQEKKN